jgi:hypothetical protein
MKPQLTAALLTWAMLAGAGPAAAQGEGVTLDQVERQYPRMSVVHIVKCDRDGDGLFGRGELQCVRGIYSAMYLED